jgi:CBS-domain-containing membrane protein
MISTPRAAVGPRLYLEELSAADLMTANPVSVGQGATVADAVELLTRRGISAAPVIDEAGRPVGVISRADVLVHDREAIVHAHDPGEPLSRDDVTYVRDIMTPIVFCVAPDTPASRVVRELLDLKVHRMFVVDDDGVLVGVVSVLDVLRHLKP